MFEVHNKLLLVLTLVLLTGLFFPVFAAVSVGLNYFLGDLAFLDTLFFESRSELLASFLSAWSKALPAVILQIWLLYLPLNLLMRRLGIRCVSAQVLAMPIASFLLGIFLYGLVLLPLMALIISSVMLSLLPIVMFCRTDNRND